MAKKNHNVQQFKNALKIEIKQWKILWAYAKKYYKILQICKICMRQIANTQNRLKNLKTAMCIFVFFIWNINYFICKCSFKQLK